MDDVTCKFFKVEFMYTIQGIKVPSMGFKPATSVHKVELDVITL